MVWPGLWDTQLALILPIARALLLQRGPGLFPQRLSLACGMGWAHPSWLVTALVCHNRGGGSLCFILLILEVSSASAMVPGPPGVFLLVTNAQ